MALSKIYKKRLEQLHEDVDRSISNRLEKCNHESLGKLEEEYSNLLFDCLSMFKSKPDNLFLEAKIELLTKLEEL